MTDHTTAQLALRDRVAETLARADGWEWAAANFSSLFTPTTDRYRKQAEAVLALLADDGAARQAGGQQPDGITVPGITAEQALAGAKAFGDALKTAQPSAAQLIGRQAEPGTGCAHCGGPHSWDDCEKYTALVQADAAPAAGPDDTQTADARQPAYTAVYAHIRALGDHMPPDPVHRNAMIWRAVHAALDATPVGRCVSSHCVEGDHVLIVEEDETR
ncbi:hypothetical protein ACFZDF_30515 [Streptomyces sp. NPDC007910]|uniref:hypothetical protein n=1 Tax=Streptomyces sp. NPDC007910 TaxID=3364790 RepID=UPI0036E3A93A